METEWLNLSIKRIKPLKMENVLDLVHPYLCGIDTPHSPEFRIDRRHDPYGSCLLLGFRSNVEILTARGMETGESGDCIIHTPEFRQYHAAVPGADSGYRNDWIHIGAEIAMPVVKKYGLEFNTLLPAGSPGILSPFIGRIQREANGGEPFRREWIVLEIEQMLLTVARLVRGRAESALTRAEERYRDEFSALRARLLEKQGKTAAVPDLAAELHLSPERFSVLYKKFFRCTPYDDLLEMRLNYARSLLIATSFSMKEIAGECGWRDEHYFSRIFRRKTGMTPTVFRAGSR